MTPELLAVTDEFIVVNKPAGMLTHPTAGSNEPALTDWLCEKFPELRGVGDEPDERPGLVHRLDRDASGALVVARTPAAFALLKNQFQQRTIKKEYLVLVYGRVARDFGEINFPIGRGADGRMAARPQDHEGSREAHTEYEVVERFTNVTLLRVRIHTGRTHQIRVHLFAIQHPVVGDTVYKPRLIAKSFPLPPRLFLHAARLTFVDGAHTTHTYEPPLPAELQKYLKEFKPVT